VTIRHDHERVNGKEPAISIPTWDTLSLDQTLALRHAATRLCNANPVSVSRAHNSRNPPLRTTVPTLGSAWADRVPGPATHRGVSRTRARGW
jgi:hypothetical protein